MDKEQQTLLLECIRESLADPAGNSGLGSAIARLLDLHLARLDEWNHRWMDDLLDIRVRVNGSRTEVIGYIVWGTDGRTTQWMDPLQALWSIDNDGNITRYDLRFGDESRQSE